MFDDNEDNVEGISIESLSIGKNFYGRNSYLNVSIQIKINEPMDVAQVDATELEERISAAINSIVADYASDGQEVDE